MDLARTIFSFSGPPAVSLISGCMASVVCLFVLWYKHVLLVCENQLVMFLGPGWSESKTHNHHVL